MEVFTCPHGTGKTFTNKVIFDDHVKKWPEIAEQNGLNLDGTTKPKKLEQPKPKEPKPIDFGKIPYNKALAKEGITSVEDIPRDLKSLKEVKGIGDTSAKEILKYLELFGS